MKSTAEIVFNQTSVQPAGTKITIKQLHSRNPAHSTSGINAALHKMRTLGYLDGSARGEYIVNEKTTDYGEKLSFRAKPDTMASKRTKRQVAKILRLGGDDVLQNLLDAMAKAEPEIRRLMEVDAAAKKFADKVA